MMNQSNDSELLERRRTIWRSIFTCLRFFLWLGVLLFVPFAIAPEFAAMLDEFGLELPFITQLTLSLSDKAWRLAYFYVPIALTLLTCWELLILLTPNKTLSRVLKYCDWAQLTFVILFVVISLVIPTLNVIAALLSE